MQLRLKSHQSHHGPAWFVILFAAALSSWRPHRVDAESHLPDLPSRQTKANLNDQKCRPVLNFALPHPNQSNVRLAENGETQNMIAGQKLSQSIPNSFSFAIGDINLPLTQTGGGAQSNGGTVQAAMKLLAAFDAQIYGDDEEDRQEEENVVKFKENRLHLAGLNFTMLNVHLYQNDEPRFAIGVNIANTTLAGRFQYDGYAPTSLMGADYSKMAGHYRMSIDNLLLTVSSNLTKVALVEGSTSESLKFKFQLASNDLRINISNIGYVSIEILDARDASKPTSNYVLKMLQRLLQKTIKRTYNQFEDYIRSTLEQESRRFLDCELTRFSPLLAENQKNQTSRGRQPKSADNETNSTLSGPVAANTTYLDDLAKIISTEIANSRLDRISLPDFAYQRGVFGSNADINFHNGSLDGLNHIKLNGETRVKLQEEHLIVSASVGWFDLRPHYNWTLYFGAAHETAAPNASLASPASASPNQTLARQPAQNKPMAKGFVSFNIKAVDFDAMISKSIRSHSKLVVDELVIRRLDNPKMDIGGLPGMNRLTRGAVNFFMGRLKQRLVSSIQPVLKQELERTLNRLALFN